MRRVSVVGSSGSGKSTTAAALASRLAVPHHELDGVFHQANWEQLPDDEFRARVAALAADDGWVIDGNYSRARDIVWARADTIVFLDYPKPLVMSRLVRRSVLRSVLRTELWNGNRERWSNLFSRDPEQSVVVWSWQNFERNRERYRAAMADPALGHIDFRWIRSRRDLSTLIASADGGSGSG